MQVTTDGPGVLVKPEIAIAQIAADVEAAEQAQARARAAATSAYTKQTAGLPAVAERQGAAILETPVPTPLFPTTPIPEAIEGERLKTRFHGTIKLDPRQPSKQIPNIAAEVLQHLTSLLDCKVEITLEIHAENMVRLFQIHIDSIACPVWRCMFLA